LAAVDLAGQLVGEGVESGDEVEVVPAGPAGVALVGALLDADCQIVLVWRGRLASTSGARRGSLWVIRAQTSTDAVRRLRSPQSVHAQAAVCRR
jgi:hypothetical protein